VPRFGSQGKTTVTGETLKAALIGLGSAGSQLLEALLQSDRIELLGVADRDPARAERIGGKVKLPYYNDDRSLLAQTRPQAVFVSAPPMIMPELLAACVERGIHVWKQPPLARNLAEGVQMVRLMDSAGLKLAVGTQRRFSPGYSRACRLLSQLGAVYLARAQYMFNWGPLLGWRGDKSSAGGGALLELGYHLIDLLVWMLGLPEEVYGVVASGHRPEQTGPQGEDLPAYDTDDTASAVLRYPRGCAADVVVTRRSGPFDERLWLHSRRGSIEADPHSCALRDPDGNLLERDEVDPSCCEALLRQAEAFAAAVRSGAKKYECSARENLLNLAVIEAIYLSSRTSQPESPLRLLQTHELDAAKCLTDRPPAAGPPHAALEMPND